MKIFVSFFNNSIERISTEKEDLTFDEYDVDDLDFFQ